MKKGRGKKKVNSSHKKKKTFFFFSNNKIAPTIFVIALLALAVFLFINNSTRTGNAIAGGNLNSIGSSALDSPTPSWMSSVTNFLGIGETWKQVIIGIIVLLIIFAGLYDIIELTSIFSNNWVIALIAAGLSIIAALVDLVRNIATWLFAFAATLGTIGIVLEIIISIIIFIGLSFGGSKIAIWAAKRKAQKEQIKAITGAGQASAAITGLKMIQKKFKGP